LACLGGEAGALLGQSRDLSSTTRRTFAWGAATASTGLRWPAEGRVALALDVEGWVSFGRPGFKFDGVSGAYRPSRGGVRGSLGADLRFGKAVTRKPAKAATKS